MSGGKYAKRNDAEHRRRSRHAPDEPGDAPTGERWCPPAQYDCFSGSGTIVSPLSATARILQRLEYDDRRLVYYSISLQCLTVAGQWEDIARIDCSHCEIHLHHPGSPEPMTLQPITVPEDVFHTYDDSYRRIHANWEEFERQWSNGRHRP